MPRDSELYLRDIARAIAEIREWCIGMDRTRFENDKKTSEAVERNLVIIGEAAKKLPEPVKAKSSEVEWREVAGFRDVLAHDYFDVDVEIVWDVVRSKLPELERAVARLLGTS
jgi:uncharacterized protein with HEPN domain